MATLNIFIWTLNMGEIDMYSFLYTLIVGEVF